MALVIFGGLLLLAFFVLFGWLWGHDAAGMARGARMFMPVWILVALVNMWVGVTRAGYTVREELPILIVVAAIPVIVAMIVGWFLTRG
jgi:hypothetical protein